MGPYTNLIKVAFVVIALIFIAKALTILSKDPTIVEDNIPANFEQ